MSKEIIKIQNNAKLVRVLINACDSYIRNYEQYQGDMDDVILAASFSKEIQKNTDTLVDAQTFDADERDEQGEKYTPNMDPDADMPGHHWVIGKGWVKNRA